MLDLIQKLYEMMIIIDKHDLKDDFIKFIGNFKITNNEVIDTRNGKSYSFSNIDEIYGIINLLETEFFQRQNINVALERIIALCHYIAKLDECKLQKTNDFNTP